MRKHPSDSNHASNIGAEMAHYMLSKKSAIALTGSRAFFVPAGFINGRNVMTAESSNMRLLKNAREALLYAVMCLVHAKRFDHDEGRLVDIAIDKVDDEIDRIGLCGNDPDASGEAA